MNPAPPFDPLPPGADGVDWRRLLPVSLRKAHRQPPTDLLAVDLLIRLSASARAVHAGFMRKFGPAGFNDHKFIVLVVLSAFAPEPSTASRLAEYAAVTRASMTKVLDDLERRRWIERHRDSDDRRSLRVHLTPNGQRSIVDAASLYVSLAADLVGDLPSADLAAFARICARLHTASSALPGESSVRNSESTPTLDDSS
jgi:MarR family transcriptional repressor of emrRAB